MNGERCATAFGARERTNQTSSKLYMHLLSIHVTLHSSILLYCKRVGKLIKALTCIQSLLKLSDFTCGDIAIPHFKTTGCPVLLLFVRPRAFGKPLAGTGNYQFVQLHIYPLHTSWPMEYIRAEQTDSF